MKALLGATLVLACTACGGHGAGLKPFVGTWYGHTRELIVNADGTGREAVGDGCCDPIVTVGFTVVKARNGAAQIRVTSVRVYDRRPFGKKNPEPVPGERGTIALRGGVFTSSVTGSTYCEPNVSRCGA